MSFRGSTRSPDLAGPLDSTCNTTQPHPAVGVVNEAFAKRSLGGASPIGEQIKSLHGHIENGKFVDTGCGLIFLSNHVVSDTSSHTPIFDSIQILI